MRINQRWRGFVLSAIFFATAGTLTASDAGDALARFDGGEIRLDDVAREAMFVSRDESQYRQVQGHDEARRRRDWAQRQALRRIARLEAAKHGWTRQPERAEAARQRARSWLLGVWREDCYGQAFAEPDAGRIEADLREEVGEVPRRQRLSHIFLRAEGEQAVADAVARLRAMREQAVGLDSFRTLARQHSQSESAAKGGALGMVWPGFLDAKAEQALADLPAGALSEPIVLRGGVHLFLVEEVLPAGPPKLDARLKRRVAEAASVAREACRQLALQAAKVEAIRDQETLIVGDWRVPVALARASQAQVIPDEAAIQAYIDDERLYQAARSGPLESQQRARLTDLEDDYWLGELVLDRLGNLVGDPQEAELKAFFAALEKPPVRRERLAFVQLSVELPPAGVDPLIMFDRLRELREAIEAKADTWEALARAMQGDLKLEVGIKRWPATDIWHIAEQLGPPLLEALRPLQEGQVVGPVREERLFHLLQLTAREATRPLEFAEAREDIERRWRKQRERAARGAIVAALLKQYQFSWNSGDASSDGEKAGDDSGSQRNTELRDES